MASFLVQLLHPLAVALVAASFVLCGNYYLQNRVARRLRDADEIKRLLYELLDLAVNYWTVQSKDCNRRSMEAKIISSQLRLSSELGEMQRHSRNLKDWYKEIESQRLDLMDAVSGGCFQQKKWQADDRRVARAGREIGRIVRALNRAC